MTAALQHEVGAVAPARKLRIVRDTDRAEAPGAQQRDSPHRQPDFVPGGDPLLDGTARLLSVPVRHVYAALWRVGVLEVQARIDLTASIRLSPGSLRKNSHLSAQ